MLKKIKFRERRNKLEMKNNLEKVNFLENKKQGITLIALVVTIVVLLILASVSITAVFGNNGILELAEEARDKTNQAVEKEQEDITNLTNDMKDLINGEKTLVQMFKEGELKVGDYINYVNPTEGSYTAEAEKTGTNRAEGYNIGAQTFSVVNNQLSWRILGIDKETGGLKLISGKPIKNDRINTEAKDPYFYMYGAKGYLNGKEELNNIAAIFKNEEYAQKVRSVTVEDINEVVGIKTEEDIKNVDVDGYYDKTYQFENHYTPESWLNGQTEITVSGTSDGYAYKINCGVKPVKVEDEELFNMLFDNIEYNYNELSGASYWLCSSSVIGFSKEARFCLGSVYDAGKGETAGPVACVFYSNYHNGEIEHLIGAGVRAVAILKPELTLKQLQKIEPVTEEIWEYEHTKSTANPE